MKKETLLDRCSDNEAFEIAMQIAELKRLGLPFQALQNKLNTAMSEMFHATQVLNDKGCNLEVYKESPYIIFKDQPVLKQLIIG